MACGAPAIATDCPSGPSEIIEQGRSGILVPVGDEREFAAAIKRVLDDQELRNSLSEAGRRAAAAFSVSSMIQSYESALLGTDSATE
jgi:glycosyltransferase involved in cell wall biosynthesis